MNGQRGRRCVVASPSVVLAVSAWGTANVGAAVARKGFPKACALFTSDLAASALGGPVNPATQTQPNPRETICKYTRSDGMGFGNTQVGSWTVIKPLSKRTKIPGIGD